MSEYYLTSVYLSSVVAHLSGDLLRAICSFTQAEKLGRREANSKSSFSVSNRKETDLLRHFWLYLWLARCFALNCLFSCTPAFVIVALFVRNGVILPCQDTEINNCDIDRANEILNKIIVFTKMKLYYSLI